MTSFGSTHGSIASKWASLAALVISPDASDEQRSDMRKTFYSGANAMFDLLVRELDPDAEATPADLDHMSNLENELFAFAHEMGAHIEYADDETPDTPASKTITFDHRPISRYSQLKDVPDNHPDLDTPLPIDAQPLLIHLIESSQRISNSLTALREKASTAATWRDLRGLGTAIEDLV
jgi:hypothetical protein